MKHAARPLERRKGLNLSERVRAFALDTQQHGNKPVERGQITSKSKTTSFEVFFHASPKIRAHAGRESAHWCRCDAPLRSHQRLTVAQKVS